MENRQPALETGKPHNVARPRDNALQWPSIGMRPLSDIREITEPSLIDMVKYARSHSEQAPEMHQRKTSRSNSAARRGGSISRNGSNKATEAKSRMEHAQKKWTF